MWCAPPINLAPEYPNHCRNRNRREMPAIAWDERILEAVSRAKDASAAHFEAVCKLAVLVFHDEKQSRRRLTRTASSLGWSDQQAEDLVLAIAKILMDAAKAELAGSQLQASLQGMSLPLEHVTVLSSLYQEHRDMIKESASRSLTQSMAAYRSLDWRVDIEIANRGSRNNPTPIITLALNTSTPSPDGLPQSETMCFRSDFTTLKKLQSSLEVALKEVDSAHASRMQRYLH